jgi:hypothetical protein
MTKVGVADCRKTLAKGASVEWQEVQYALRLQRHQTRWLKATMRSGNGGMVHCPAGRLNRGRSWRIQGRVRTAKGWDGYP